VIQDYVGANQCCRTCVSGHGNHSLLTSSKGSQLAIQFFHYRLSLFPVQLRVVSWVDIIAKSNKFPCQMILVWDRKRVNVARYSVEDHLIGWWVGRRTHFVSGRQTVGPKRAPETDWTRPFHFISGGSDVRLKRPVWGGPDVQWSKKAPIVFIVYFKPRGCKFVTRGSDDHKTQSLTDEEKRLHALMPVIIWANPERRQRVGTLRSYQGLLELTAWLDWDIFETLPNLWIQVSCLTCKATLTLTITTKTQTTTLTDCHQGSRFTSGSVQ